MAIPFLYAGLNFLSAPSAESLDTLFDGHSRECACMEGAKAEMNGCSAKSMSRQKKAIYVDVSASNVPEICDIDVSIINGLQSEMLHLKRQEGKGQQQHIADSR